MIFNIVDLAKVEDEVISVDFVTIFEVGTADICLRCLGGGHMGLLVGQVIASRGKGSAAHGVVATSVQRSPVVSR